MRQASTHPCPSCGEQTDLKSLCESCIEQQFGPGKRSEQSLVLMARRRAAQRREAEYVTQLTLARAVEEFDVAGGAGVSGPTLDILEEMLRDRLGRGDEVAVFGSDTKPEAWGP